MLWSSQTLFLCDWFVPREHLQKSITFRLKPRALIEFPFFLFFVLWCTLWEKQLINFWEAQHEMCLFGLCLAGVAEQFALAEAAMNVWSMSDNTEQPSTSLQGRCLLYWRFIFVFHAAIVADPLCLNTNEPNAFISFITVSIWVWLIIIPKS